MKCVRNIGASLAVVSLFIAAAVGQETAPPKEFGGAFNTLSVRQQRLLVEWSQRRAQLTGERQAADEIYNSAPESVRTTFEAVTHALLNTKLEIPGSDGPDRHAFSLVTALEQVLGEREGATGDKQYRIYVRLVPDAIDVLRSCNNFEEGHNGVYHKGYPLSFRIKGTPSVQFSVTEDGRRADIDVDYRSSAAFKALFNGHLSAHNSDVRPAGNYDKHVNRWQGLQAWWAGLFGLNAKDGGFKVDVDPTLLGESPIPEAGRKELDGAVQDFLHSWLVEHNVETTLAYFDDRADSCVQMPDGGAADNRRSARFELYREMRGAAVKVGKVDKIDDVLVQAKPWRDDLNLVSSSHPYVLFSAAPDILREIDCDRDSDAVDFVDPKKLADYYKDAQGAIVALRPKEGDPIVLQGVWQKTKGAWRIIGFTRGETEQPLSPLSEAPPDYQPPAEVQEKVVEGDPQQIAAAHRLFNAWLVDKDFGATLREADPAAFHCWSANASRADIEKMLGAVAETAGDNQTLATALEAARPAWYLEHGVVKHPDEKYFDIVTGPEDKVAEDFTCGADIADGQKTWVTSTHFIGPRTGHSVLLFRWAKTDGNWKVVAARVEAP